MPSNATCDRCARSATHSSSNLFKTGLSGSTARFPANLPIEGRAILWRDTGCDPDDPTTWTQPVVRLGYYGQEPFRKAVNTPCSMRPSTSLSEKAAGIRARTSAAFRCAFHSPTIPATPAGMSTSVSPARRTIRMRRMISLSWRVNVTSRDRALLMLFLFSDVGERDAPTRIRVGSHLDIARFLEPAGEAGMSR